MSANDNRHDHAPLSPELLADLALFPLPGAIFFPGTMLPLHIFEERYRVMTREAIEDGLPICVLKLLEPRQRDSAGRPAYHDVGGVGFVLHHQELEDGRYNILLEGSARVRILEELDTPKPYRVGRAEIIPNVVDLSGSVNALMTALRGCVAGLGEDYDRLSAALEKTINNAPDPGVLADAIASIIISDRDERQALLEEPRVAERLDRVIERLSELIAKSQSAAATDPWLN